MMRSQMNWNCEQHSDPTECPDALIGRVRKNKTQWIAGLPESEKTALLSRLAIDNEHGLRAELLRRYHHTRPTVDSPTAAKSRTVAELLDEVERRERQRLAREGRREPRRRSARRPDGDENCR
jgi:hypothetical protein